MALKAVLAADVRTLDQVPETPAAAASTVRIPAPAVGWSPERKGGFVVVGHRGKGMNSVASPDRRMRAVRENSLLSFNQAGRFPVDLVDFDVQVGKLLLRRAKDERVLNWNVEIDDSLCTLEEAFLKVDSHLGFNIQLKFDDHAVYREQELNRALGSVLRVVSEHANDRPIIFSTFQPDAAQLLRKLQCVCPVFFLTEAGTGIFDDARRNSLDEAIKLCLESGLQGIVSEVRGVLRDPSAVPRIKESNVALLTNGQLNNIPKVVYMC